MPYELNSHATEVVLADIGIEDGNSPSLPTFGEILQKMKSSDDNENKDNDDDNDYDEVEDIDDGDKEGDEDAAGSKDGDGDEGEDGSKHGDDDDDDNEDGVQGKGTTQDANAAKDRDEKLVESEKNKDGGEDVAPGRQPEEENREDYSDDTNKEGVPDAEKVEDHVQAEMAIHVILADNKDKLKKIALLE
ncbi:hypothetical protein E2562_036717 [Oryza meyeriana var. granulata]|uniref:Uncharacterized protein n=1 Tax=Oryza meyeriana var. granulata TaxID=110450 RepID=A0A6G1CL83_9ORYZ|nr:hypothetical protein E2562_036717 [Oryza meyeriana var. granulata]